MKVYSIENYLKLKNEILVHSFEMSIFIKGITELENDLLSRTALFEDWAMSFVDQCLQVIENSSREQTRQETDQMDDTLNEEEIAADCTISDTFHKMMVKCSPSIFQLVFKKIKHHVQTRILEPAVSTKIKNHDRL